MRGCCATGLLYFIYLCSVLLVCAQSRSFVNPMSQVNFFGDEEAGGAGQGSSKHSEQLHCWHRRATSILPCSHMDSPFFLPSFSFPLPLTLIPSSLKDEKDKNEKIKKNPLVFFSLLQEFARWDFVISALTQFLRPSFSAFAALQMQQCCVSFQRQSRLHLCLAVVPAFLIL